MDTLIIYLYTNKENWLNQTINQSILKLLNNNNFPVVNNYSKVGGFFDTKRANLHFFKTKNLENCTEISNDFCFF
jgi:hypothetical protein